MSTDPLTLAYCKMADMALALAKTRVFVAVDIEMSMMPVGESSKRHVEYCRDLLAEIDKALRGTIHEFKQPEKTL